MQTCPNLGREVGPYHRPICVLLERFTRLYASFKLTSSNDRSPRPAPISRKDFNSPRNSPSQTSSFSFSHPNRSRPIGSQLFGFDSLRYARVDLESGRRIYQEDATLATNFTAFNHESPRKLNNTEIPFPAKISRRILSFLPQFFPFLSTNQLGSRRGVVCPGVVNAGRS